MTKYLNYFSKKSGNNSLFEVNQITHQSIRFNRLIVTEIHKDDLLLAGMYLMRWAC